MLVLHLLVIIEGLMTSHAFLLHSLKASTSSSDHLSRYLCSTHLVIGKLQTERACFSALFICALRWLTKTPLWSTWKGSSSSDLNRPNHENSYSRIMCIDTWDHEDLKRSGVWHAFSVLLTFLCCIYDLTAIINTASNQMARQNDKPRNDSPCSDVEHPTSLHLKTRL